MVSPFVDKICPNVDFICIYADIFVTLQYKINVISMLVSDFSRVSFVYGVGGAPVGRVLCSTAALRWRAGVVARLRFECVLSSGRLSVVFVPVASCRAAAFRCRAFCAGRGVVACSAFLSDGRWVCSSVA